MKKTVLLTIATLSLTTVALPALAQPGKISDALDARASTVSPTERLTVWVYFSDKGPGMEAALAAARDNLTPRARARRLKHRGAGNLVDHLDVPVKADYVAAIARPGVRIRHESRWLNAVSVEVERRKLDDIASLPFVARLDVVRSGRREPLPEPKDPRAGASRAPGSTTLYNYGNSFTQNDLINVIPLHQLGYNGNGVLVCMLDSGFNNLGHDAFASMDIIATWDFVNNDEGVEDHAAQMGTGDHGTHTLSTIGGWAPGEVIGPAWGATFALGKTENTEWERHIEEDHWVAGAEWADSLGADIISSSVGYRYFFTDGETGYLWTDMDGNTAISTIGADIAASKGILVITASGNHYYTDPPQNTIIAPSDGDSVLCVGAVDGAGARVNFSSVGPSADGRIKPDVMAMGLGVRCASESDPSGYRNVQGASFSCPLVAGAAALMLEANPSLTNVEVMDALRATASQSATPDRLMGYGIIDAAAAAASVSIHVAEKMKPLAVVLRPAYPNPFNPTTTIEYEIPGRMHVTIAVYNVRGQLVRTLVDEGQSPGLKFVNWNGVDRFGRPVSSGVYVYRLMAGDVQRSRKMVLLK